MGNFVETRVNLISPFRSPWNSSYFGTYPRCLEAAVDHSYWFCTSTEIQNELLLSSQSWIKLTAVGNTHLSCFKGLNCNARYGNKFAFICHQHCWIFAEWNDLVSTSTVFNRIYSQFVSFLEIQSAQFNLQTFSTCNFRGYLHKPGLIP